MWRSGPLFSLPRKSAACEARSLRLKGVPGRDGKRRARPQLEALEGRWLPAVHITEFAGSPPGINSPASITAGPDGNLWFTEPFVNQIGRITPAGNVTLLAIPGGAVPSTITAGPDGNLWFTELLRDGIFRLTPGGAFTEFPGPSTARLPGDEGITTGPDGNLWFTQPLAATVGRISPAGSITEFTLPSADSQPALITAGPDGALWFTEAQGPQGKIGRITTGGTVTEFALPEGVLEADGITEGPDGNLWFTAKESALNPSVTGIHGFIGRITPAGAVTLFATAQAGFPAVITAGPDGNLWFTMQFFGGAGYPSASDNVIGQITPGGVITYYTTPTSVSVPVGITAGPDATLWVTERRGAIARISFGPATPGSDSSPSPSLPPNQTFVAQLYEDLLGRPADAAGLGYWTSLLDQGQSRTRVAQGIEAGPEYRTDAVRQLYARLLNRPADPAGLQAAVNLLAQGGTEEQLEALLLGSDEYLQARSQGTAGGFVQAAYQDVLQRSPSAGELQGWLQQLGSGLSRPAVALAILTSAEAETLEVESLYQQLLGRPADSSGLGFFVGALQGGASREQVAAVLAGSQERFAAVNGPLHQRYVAQLYRDLLGREAGPADFSYWVGLLNQGLATPQQVVQQIEQSTEYLTRQVQTLYGTFLHRAPDAGGLQGFVAFLAQSGTPEQAALILTMSPEYFLLHGNTGGGLLQGLYEEALGRAPDAGAVAGFGPLVSQPGGQAQVAAAVFSSPEYRQDLLQRLFTQTLHRSPDPSGLASAMTLLNEGARDDQVLAALASSEEYFVRLA